MIHSSQNLSPYPLSAEEKSSLASLVHYNSVQSLPEIWPEIVRRFHQIIAVHDPHSQPEIKWTYGELYQQIQDFASGLQSLGFGVSNQPLIPPRVALFADNSPRWLVADQGIMMAGGANVVRGATTDPQELLFILKDSGSTALVLEDLALFNQLRKSLEDLPILLIVLLSDEEVNSTETLPVVKFSQVIMTGKDRTLKPISLTRETLATLIYTSGTTGQPKGVMLTYQNLLHQVTTLGTVIQPHPGDVVLSLLPSWHAYERAAEYFLFSQGCCQIYTNIRYFKQDLKHFKPQYMVSVPRIWDSIYEAVQKQFREQPPARQKLINFFLNQSKKYIEASDIWRGWTQKLTPPTSGEKLSAFLTKIFLFPVHLLGEKLVYKKIREATGGKFKWAISGGGSLALHLDYFFTITGIGLLVGYGLTETSPVLTARRPWHNVKGSAGQPIPGTEIKIIHPETRQPLPPGERGLVLARGPQIMQGYFLNPEATAKAINDEGWFDTGDLGYLLPSQDLMLTGRAKDTIVLTSGENIEPQPIEDACLRSPYIDQIMLVGQDQKSLGALIVPHRETVEKWLQEKNLPLETLEESSKILEDFFRKEANREVQNRPGYRPDDRIGPVRLLKEPLSMENGMLTQTLKIKRPVVMEHYRDMIDKMFN